jgi:hypothetical protein
MRTRHTTANDARHPWDHRPPEPDHPASRPIRWVVRLVALALIALSLYPAIGEDAAGVDVAVSCDPTIIGVATNCVATLTRSTDATSSFPVRVGTYDNEQGGVPTQAEAVARAQQFDVITAWARQYKPYVAAMKAANPDLVLRAYVNGTHTWRTGLPESQYCHDASGARVTTTGLWPGTFLMDPGHTGWRNQLLDTVRATIADSGFDGVFLDTLGRGALTYTVTGRCMNPGTGDEYTVAEWESSTSELARWIKVQTGLAAVANGASNGVVYFGSPPSSQVARYVDGGLAEGFTRNGAFAAGSAGESQIVKDVAMLADAPVMNVLTKDWREVDASIKDREMRYAFGTFLLGTDGRDVFGWTGSRSVMTSLHPLWNVDLGTPQGLSYALGSGRYRRNFDRGYVIVNSVDRTGFIAAESGNILSATWTTSGAGTFEELGCTTVDVATTTCQARYLPAPGSSGVHEIKATSASGAGQAIGTANLTVTKRVSATVVACTSPVAASETSTCTTTVTDTGPGIAVAPVGSVTFSSLGGGSFGSARCALVPGPTSSSCSAVYTPTVGGDHQVTVAFDGDANHVASASAPTVVTVEPTVVQDVTSPVVQIVSPANDTTIKKGRTVRVVATATDDIGVTTIEVAANGVVMCSEVETSAMTCSWSVPKRGSTDLTVTVTAWDVAGNVGSQQIQIRVGTGRL